MFDDVDLTETTDDDLLSLILIVERMISHQDRANRDHADLSALLAAAYREQDRR